MSQILNKLRDVDPNNSEAIKEALSPFFQQLSKHIEVNCGQWLKALEGAINRFPKYCMSQRGNIESYLAHFLDSTNYYFVIEAAKCAHALQQVRPTQEKTATSKSCWRDLMSALCNAIHSLLGAMFPNAVDIYQQMGRIQKEQHSPNSPLATTLSQLCSATAKPQNNAVLKKQTLLSTRLRNVFVFIQAMLVEIYPVAKPIRPQTILDVIMRSLSVSSGDNTSQNLADIVTVKTEALRSLDALIVCLGPNLIPFSPLVFRFVMQTLKWSSDNPGEQSSVVRRAAYSSLGLWLSCLHSHRPRARSWQDELTEHILSDITHNKHVVELKMSSRPTKNMSKKAKRKLANSMMMESNISSHMPGEKNKMAASEELNEEVAIAALECAEIFFTVCGMFLKPATHKRFQERLVRSSYSMSSYSPSLSLALLRALEAARKAAPPTVAPHTHLALQLYSSIANDSTNKQISNFCAQALLDIRMHLHCSPPTLTFSVQAEPDSSREEKKKQISQRNRAALEELLGADKVPKQSVITITDEPPNKKHKVDETDKISLSSESTGSIEISDDTDAEESVLEEVEVIIETVENEQIHPDTEVDIVPIVDEVESVNSKESEAETELRNKKAKTIDITEDDIHDQVTQLPNAHIDKDVSEDKVDSTQSEKEEDAANLEVASNTIFEAETQLPPNATILDATTQVPLHISNEDEEETPLSMEVAYDYPNTGQEKVPILEKLDGDNLPSTNETDDIQITCGQVVKNSQDIDTDAKKPDINNKISEVKVNGTDDTNDKPVQNGDVTASNATEVVGSKDLNVEDMLADFVDEVNDDTQATQAY